MVGFGFRTNVSDFCRFLDTFFSSMQKGQNTPMLHTNVTHINVKTNMGGELKKLGKTQNCILGGGGTIGDHISPDIILSDDHLGWQP